MHHKANSSRSNFTDHASPEMIAWFSVFALSVICYVYLSNVFTGQNLHVWGDEIIYSIDSRRNDLSGAYYPNFLFLKFFSLTSYAGTGFLEFARSLNAAMIAGSIPFIYLISIRFCSRPIAVFVAALSVAGPISTYAAYYMPDAMYFASFYVFAWVCLSMSKRPGYLYGIVIGLLCAVLSYIKPHGMFVLIAFILTQIILSVFNEEAGRFKRCSVITVSSVLSFIIIHFFLGFLLSGKTGTGFVGGYSQFTSIPWGWDQLLSAAKLTLILIRGHTIAVCLLLSMALLALFVRSEEKGLIIGRNLFELRIFAVSQFLLMFFITIAFSVRIADGAPFVDTMRVHMRYYNLFFPLLYIVAASLLGTSAQSSAIVRFISLPIMATLISVFFGGLDGLIPTELDAPELRGVTASHSVLLLVALMSVCCIAAFLYKPKYGAKAYIFIMLPLTLVIGSYFVNNDLRGRLQDMQGDKAGKIVKTFLGDEAKGVGFFGDVVSICQAQFYAGDSDSFLYLLPEGMPVPEHLSPGLPVEGHLIPPGKLMPSGTKWIVVFGDHPVPDKYRPVLSYPGWALYQAQN